MATLVSCFYFANFGSTRILKMQFSENVIKHNPELGDFFAGIRYEGLNLGQQKGRARCSIIDERSFSKAILSGVLLGLDRQNTVHVMSANS